MGLQGRDGSPPSPQGGGASAKPMLNQRHGARHPRRPRPAQLAAVAAAAADHPPGRPVLPLRAPALCLAGEPARQSRMARPNGSGASGPCPARLRLDLCRGGGPLAAGGHRAHFGRRLDVRAMAGNGGHGRGGDRRGHAPLPRRPHRLRRQPAPARGTLVAAAAGGISGRCLQLSAVPAPGAAVPLLRRQSGPGRDRRAAADLRAGDRDRHHSRDLRLRHLRRGAGQSAGGQWRDHAGPCAEPAHPDGAWRARPARLAARPASPLARRQKPQPGQTTGGSK